MTGKLRDYQVLDVLCGGTFYKVRHKVTNNIFAWRAYDCSAYSDEQIQNVVKEVKIITEVHSDNQLRYYDTILHAPSKTLYFVLEYSSWRSLNELIAACKDSDKYIAEGFIWYLLFELARLCKAVERLKVVVLRKCITPASVFVGDECELRVNCFELEPAAAPKSSLMRQVGDVAYTLCSQPTICDEKIQGFHYSDDLRDVISFLTYERNANLRPDVILHHPTVLANLETLAGPKHLGEILLSGHNSLLASDANKCDSEKAVELCRLVEPVPRTYTNLLDSPVYSNISPKKKINKQLEESQSPRGSVSPTLAALALELPGFVPRNRKPYNQALETYKPQQISEETLSRQWMTRLIALRQREESLNKRERELISKEIVSSPATKIISLDECFDIGNQGEINGITLPPVIQAEERGQRASRRRRRRSGSVRPKNSRKSYAYEDLDSSLSADPGDGSIIVTTTKFTKENMPRRNIFPDVLSKKVHFTSANPFAESDESVTLTFYELENVHCMGDQMQKPKEPTVNDITKFKYLDLEKMTSEKRAAMQQWNQSSPSKQAKMNEKMFADITNANEGMKRSPSKASLVSKCSNSSKYSNASSKSQWSMELAKSKVSGDCISERTRSSMRQSLAPIPVVPPEVKKSKRKSLLPFKTPFKFMTSTKI